MHALQCCALDLIGVWKTNEIQAEQKAVNSDAQARAMRMQALKLQMALLEAEESEAREAESEAREALAKARGQHITSKDYANSQ